MSTQSDGRGSNPQRYLFELCKELFKEYNVIWEQQIPDLNQRFDIFIFELGIAIEYDGDQHDNYNEFFHKDMNGYIISKKMDIQKENYCKENGIKLVRFNKDVYELSKNNLNEAINKVPYPETEFCSNVLRPRSKRLDLLRSYRKDQYLKMKSNRDST